ncbi:hypothetical protein Tco_0961093 [Tanacetum coccineum]
MANLSEGIQCSGSDTRPPMLDRIDFASWQQRIRLYCWGKENGVNILKSINEGLFRMGTFRETLIEGTEDKERYNADIQATNILLQGLPKDIYSLINHYTDAKDIWYNVKMLLEGSELTKQDRESQLYVDFEHFHQNKGETIHDYYIRLAKLINDMRNIKMTMSRMQLNSKFMNNMLPEWGRFVTAVKLNRGLRELQNYDHAGTRSRGFKASILLLIIALGDSWDLLDQRFSAIDGYRRRCVGVWIYQAKDKNKAKTTKPGMRLERAWKRAKD